MKIIVRMFVSAFMLSNSLYAQVPDWLWAKSASGSLSEYSQAVAVDDYENVIMTGYFISPSCNFGAISLSNGGTGVSDMFVAKYDSAGHPVWAHSAADADGLSVTTDA